MGIRHSKKSVDIHTATAKKGDLATAEVTVKELSPDGETQKTETIVETEKAEEPAVNGELVTPPAETNLEVSSILVFGEGRERVFKKQTAANSEVLACGEDG